MITDWLHIDWDLFQWLRPQWLWLFVPMGVITLFVLLTNRSKKTWQKNIAPHLRPFVIGKGSRWAFLGPLFLFLIATSLMIVAAAGPTWKKVEVPGAKSEAILLIALDLSASMMVEDVSPNRLERAKFKIRDLLDANPGSKVGLLVYAGTAHPVVTPCNDYELVKYQLESLNPGVMPVWGTDIDDMLAVADTIFSRTEAPSTLLLVTDDINAQQATALTSFVNDSDDQLELMALATPQGGRVPGYRKGQYFRQNGEYVISKLDQTQLFQLQQHPRINVNTLTLDKEDVQKIAVKVRDNLVFQKMDDESEEDWVEMGFPLLWIVAVIFVFWFRKGWMIQWCVLLVALSSCHTNVESWEDLWYTEDYQGQQAMDRGDYEQAAGQFQSLPHKGAAYYQAGDYESAIEIFSQDTSAASMYNLGLAYAANGQNELAQEALLLAQELDPENERITQSVEKNREIVRQIDSLRTVNPDSAIALSDQQKKPGVLNEREAASEDEQLTSDTEVDELPQDGDRVTDEVATEMRTAEELERPPEDFVPQQGESAQNVLLREISAEPAEFLRRRFRYQREKYYADKPRPQETW